MTVTATEQTCSCGGHLITTQSGDLVCEVCGLVINDTAPMVSFWGYTNERNRDEIQVDQYVGRVNPKIVAPLGSRPIRAQHVRYAALNRDYRLSRALRFLQELVCQLRIPEQTHIRAAILLRQNIRKTWQATSYVLVVACLVRAAREHQIPLRVREVVSLAKTHHAIPTRNLNVILCKLDISKHPPRIEQFIIPVISALRSDPSLLKRLTKQSIDLEDFFSRLTEETVRLVKLGIQHGSRTLGGMAAAYCYLAGRPYVTQKNVAVLAKEYTVRSHVQYLRQTLDLPDQRKREVKT